MCVQHVTKVITCITKRVCCVNRPVQHAQTAIIWMAIDVKYVHRAVSHVPARTFVHVAVTDITCIIPICVKGVHKGVQHVLAQLIVVQVAVTVITGITIDANDVHRTVQHVHGRTDARAVHLKVNRNVRNVSMAFGVNIVETDVTIHVSNVTK